MQTRTISWRKVILLCVAGLMLACTFAGPGHAQNAESGRPPESFSDPVVRLRAKKSEIQIIERFSKVVELPTRISAVDGFDPEVIEVTPLSANRVRLQAIAPGVTTMLVFDENEQAHSVEVFVSGDVRHLKAQLRQLFPDAAIEPVAVRESVVLRGFVNQPEQITQVTEVAETFFPSVLNQMRVGGVQQVQLKVRVMEVQRAKIRRMGFNFLYLNNNGALASTPGQLVPLTLGGGAFAGSPGPATIAGTITNENNTFQGFLEALKQESLLKILAEPTLTTTNGRPANMLAGGEFPILVPQSLGTTTIEWRSFGVRLEAVPIILGNGRVRLELQPEVSERDFANAVTTQGLTVPGLSTRRVNTQVEMGFGETFMLAGLLSMRRTAETDKVPFLGDMPWIGAGFRRVRYDEGETELVIMVTPQLAAPLKDGQVPPGGPGLSTTDPTARELYNSGVIEVPTYGDECLDCGPDAPLGTEPVPVSPGPGTYSDEVITPSSNYTPPAPDLSIPADVSAGHSLPELPVPPARENRQFNSTDLQPQGTAFQRFKRSTARLNPFRKTRRAAFYRNQPQNQKIYPERPGFGMDKSTSEISTTKDDSGSTLLFPSQSTTGPESTEFSSGLIAPSNISE